MRLRKQVYIYLFSNFINAALSFATVSLLTHHLDTYDYGVINLYSPFLLFLMPFITGGILYPLSVEYFKRDKPAYSTYFSNAQVIPLLSLALLTICCFVFQQELMRFLKVSAFWVWIMPLTAWLIMINETAMIITRNNNKPFQYAFFSVGKNLAEIGMTVLLVIGLHWAWQGRLLSAAIAPTLLGIISVYLFYRWKFIVKKIDWKIVRQIFWVSLPFVFERLTVFVLSNSDRYFIDRYDLNGTKEVGLYGLGSQLAMVIFLVVVSMNSAYQPYLFKKMAEGFRGKIHKTTGWYILACIATVGAMLIALPFLFRFFIGSSYQNAISYAYILCSGYFMWGIYNAFQAYLIYLNRGRTIIIISAIGMICSLALNFTLVPRMGADGAAITSVITYSVMAVACFLFVRKFFILQK